MAKNAIKAAKPANDTANVLLVDRERVNGLVAAGIKASKDSAAAIYLAGAAAWYFAIKHGDLAPLNRLFSEMESKDSFALRAYGINLFHDCMVPDSPEFRDADGKVKNRYLLVDFRQTPPEKTPGEHFSWAVSGNIKRDKPEKVDAYNKRYRDPMAFEKAMALREAMLASGEATFNRPWVDSKQARKDTIFGDVEAAKATFGLFKKLATYGVVSKGVLERAMRAFPKEIISEKQATEVLSKYKVTPETEGNESKPESDESDDSNESAPNRVKPAVQGEQAAAI